MLLIQLALPVVMDTMIKLNRRITLVLDFQEDLFFILSSTVTLLLYMLVTHLGMVILKFINTLPYLKDLMNITSRLFTQNFHLIITNILLSCLEKKEESY